MADPVPVFFAWVDPDVPFSEDLAVEDETILSLEISQAEGGFAMSRVTIRNPGIGLLAPGRKVWAWLSWEKPGVGLEPLAFGRLVGIPGDLHRETIVLEIRSAPNDFRAQKAALAEAMRVPPWWDPVWIQTAGGERDDDVVLDARAQRWNIDRVSLEVSATDINIGEGVLIEVDESTATYADTTVAISGPPLRAVELTGTVAWAQAGTGTIDITNKITSAARNPGMGQYTIGPSMDGPSLFKAWPKAGASVGPGYTWNLGSWIKDKYTGLGPDGEAKALLPFPGASPFNPYGPGFQFQVARSRAPKWVVHYNKAGDPPGPYSLIPERAEFTTGSYYFRSYVDWEADRKRTEIVNLTLVADVQPVLTDPAGADVLKLDVTAASEIDQPIDPGGATPIENALRNSYFKTGRGQSSVEYLLCLARAKLLDRARCVNISFKTTWAVASAISCRDNVHLVDRRLPGGEAIGKVIGYTLRAGGNEMSVTVTIGCTVGYGNTVSAIAGENVYIDDYIDNYFAEAGATIAIDSGDFTYQSFDDFEVEDDGLNLLDFGPDQAVRDIFWSGGPPEGLRDRWNGFIPSDATARSIISGTGLMEGDVASIVNAVHSTSREARDPMKEANAIATTLTIWFRPVQGSEFESIFTPDVSALMVPKTIDLEAPSDA